MYVYIYTYIRMYMCIYMYSGAHSTHFLRQHPNDEHHLLYTNLHIYIHIYMYICIYINIMYTYIYIHINMYICIHLYVYVQRSTFEPLPSTTPKSRTCLATSKRARPTNSSSCSLAVSRSHQGVLQCVAMCCKVLQCVAVWCSVLQRVAMCCSVEQSGAVYCSLCGFCCLSHPGVLQ